VHFQCFSLQPPARCLSRGSSTRHSVRCTRGPADVCIHQHTAGEGAPGKMRAHSRAHADIRPILNEIGPCLSAGRQWTQSMRPTGPSGRPPAAGRPGRSWRTTPAAWRRPWRHGAPLAEQARRLWTGWIEQRRMVCSVPCQTLPCRTRLMRLLRQRQQSRTRMPGLKPMRQRRIWWHDVHSSGNASAVAGLMAQVTGEVALDSRCSNTQFTGDVRRMRSRQHVKPCCHQQRNARGPGMCPVPLVACIQTATLQQVMSSEARGRERNIFIVPLSLGWTLALCTVPCSQAAASHFAL
jgi:hypothetical protein